MRILMLTTKFYHADGSLWLTSELAHEFAACGDEVTVVNLEWSGLIAESDAADENLPFELKNIKAIRCGPPWIALIARWLLSSFKTLPFLVRKLFLNGKYDLMIGFSPCAALYAALPPARLASKEACLLYWDFFPVHNQEITQKAPRFILPLLKRLEKMLVGHFSRIGCMSHRGVEFFRCYFEPDNEIELRVIPIWTSFLDGGSTTGYDKRKRLSIPADAILLVFGGQLIEGRGVAEICEAAVIAQKIDKRIFLVVCGAGPLAQKVIDCEGRFPSIVKYGGSMSRSAYIEILKEADVGVVATVAGVSAPSFPSKSLDYMACGLALLAAVEAASDFGRVVEEFQMGMACPAGNTAAMAKAIVEMTADKAAMKTMGRNAREYLKTHHAVEQVAKLIKGSPHVQEQGFAD